VREQSTGLDEVRERTGDGDSPAFAVVIIMLA